MTKIYYYIIALATTCFSFSYCTPPRNFPVNYYKENEQLIHTVNLQYQALYEKKPFAAEFTGKNFDIVSLELKTDTLRYIYEFLLNDPALKDTLFHFGYDSSSVLELVNNMRKIKCAWINNLDYYIDGNKRLLTFFSIKHKALNIPFSPKKYFILTIYEQPQYYDDQGRLLDKRDIRRLRKVNNEIFWRINDKVCYTLSARFR